MNNIKRILLIRLSGIGDILFTLPAVNLIRENFPDSEITFVTKKRFASLLQGFTALDKVIMLDSDIYHQQNIFRITKQTFDLIKTLHNQHFDLVVDFHGLEKTALIAWLTGAKQRWGLLRKANSRFFYTNHLKISDTVHRAEVNRELLLANGLQSFPPNNRYGLPTGPQAEAETLFRQLGLDPAQPTIFIQPFTNFPRKNWPLENYMRYAAYWNNQGIQILFGGGPGDLEKLQPVIEANFPVAAGKANLLTTGGLMNRCALVIGGDTGMLHLATALGKKVVMLMHRGQYQQFHPYQHPDWRVIPVNGDKIVDIPVEAALATTKSVLEGTL